ETKVIPGHGELSSRSELQAYRDMLKTIRDRVARAKGEGRTLAEVQASKPSAEWDEKWGGGFIGPDALVEAIYQSVGGR
ncbi:MAG TPA: MBL fold metallo-hydrolase, partial [Candidatus Thermoplasmatota archaeon]